MTLACWVWIASAPAQLNTNRPPVAKVAANAGHPSTPIPPKDTPLGPLNPVDVVNANPTAQSDAPERPERPPASGTPISSEVQEEIKKFQAAREAYLSRQKELARKLKDASSDDRDLARAVLSELREKWLEQQRAARQEFLDRATEIREAFKNRERDKVIEATLEEGRRNP